MIVALALAHAACGCAVAGEPVLEGAEIVARVNGDAVTRADLDRVLAQPNTGSPGAATGGERERRALRQLINRRLILQEAGRRNMQVSVEDLDQSIIDLRRRFADLASFGSWMNERGLNDQSLFDSVRESLLLARATAALVENVRISDDAVLRYYEAHKGELQTEEVWIQIIVVENIKTARDIQKALEDGKNFGTLAQRYSIGGRAELGGDVGWVDAATLWPPIREAVAMLEPGEAIGPLSRDEDEVLIVRLEDRRETAASFFEARPGIEHRLLAAKQQQMLQAWLAQQEKQSDIEVLLESD
jgi:parvulin-like peptidyl-prolyl isomerase